MVLLQAHTKKQIHAFLQRPTHGLLLNGSEGTGKLYAARSIAAELLGISMDTLQNHPYFKVIEPMGTSLSIYQIRELQKFLQLTTPGKQAIRRVVVVKDAHLMTTEAQNALLKSLEEPPPDTVIILTSPATQKLKETIYSRVQQIAILPIDKESAFRFFEANFDDTEIDKAYLLSGGRIGLMYALLHDKDHQLAREIVHAKKILSGTRYERLLHIEELTKQKDQLPVFLQACKLICTTALDQAATKDSKEQAKRWLAALTAVYEAEAALSHNPNTKLLLTNLLLRL